ncbi:MAG TPA: hypothetical protein VGJ57_03670 [Nitrospirales bacterium]|jgi:hypothetical protein
MKSFSLSVLGLLGILFLHGCATLSQENTAQFRKDNQDHLRLLTPGMTKAVVLATMGISPVSRCLHSTGGICHEFETIDNPYRRAYFDAGRKRYEVLYYYTDDQKRELKYYYQQLKRHEDDIGADQLTPVLLEDGKLAGWGRDFVDEKLSTATAVTN